MVFQFRKEECIGENQVIAFITSPYNLKELDYATVTKDFSISNVKIVSEAPLKRHTTSFSQGTKIKLRGEEH